MRKTVIVAMVLSAVAMGGLVAVAPVAFASHRFIDVPDSNIFHNDIDWMTYEGLTVGCNPPKYSRFCPDDYVTRGQMAVFFARWHPVLSPEVDYFDDDTGAFYEDAANKMFEAGITVGCNPPANNLFCGEDLVKRAQMATFFVRVFEFPTTAPDYFIDDTGSVHEDNINRFREGGVTVGCNPPKNDRYCPNDPVTRAEMAAFFHRASEKVSDV